MDFTVPWPSEVSFKGYIREHNEVIGRKWLFLEMERLLETSPYGVILTAEMGFGKSAFLSRLSCLFQGDQPGFSIRKRMVLFHMCRYDSILTLKPHLFIRNLAGSMARLHPEYGNILFKEKMALKYLNTFRCEEDPLGCFDVVILHIVQQMHDINNQFLIVVDGLDECIEYESTSIVKLLISKLHKMEGYFQLLVSSRNIQSVLSEVPLLQVYHALTNENRNILDLRNFLQHKLDSIKSLKHFLENDTFQTQKAIQDKIEKLSEGNFLFAVHFIKSGLHSFEQIPSSLFHMYQLNFDRIFSKSIGLFDEMRPVFEVLVSSFTAVEETLLFDVCEIRTEDRQRIHKVIHGELGHFVHKVESRLYLNHKSVSDFLTDSRDNNKYFISKTEGHRKYAKYLLKSNESIFDLIAHVAESGDKDLELTFVEIGKAIIKQNNYSLSGQNSILLKAASIIRSYKPMKLLLRVIGCKHVDDVGLMGNTAAFLAAGFGYIDSLRALHECGANLAFRRREPPLTMFRKFATDPVTFSKQGFWGYSLLHVASQHGHSDVVAFILKHERALLNVTNSLGLNAFQIAAEHGHTRVVMMLLWENWSFPDLHSLYQASKNNFVEIVEILLYNNVTDTCLPCSGDVYWIGKNETRYQSIDNFNHWVDWSPGRIVYKDDCRLIRCETALEVAVQNGNRIIVDLLLAQRENALHCRQYEGRTPILTAARYGRPDVVKLLLSKGANVYDRCIDILRVKHNKGNSNVALGGVK